MAIPIAKPTLGNEEVEAAREVILSGWISQGPKVAAFEEAFARYVGARYACAVSNCTTALHLALLAVGVKPGDRVITVSHSFIATANAIRYCGAEPLFVDIDPETYNLSPQALEPLLKEQKKKIAAIVVVHQMGMPADLAAIAALAKKYHIPLIEDAACAVGSEISSDGGRTWEKIGKPRGDVVCFSFHPRKVISTGEGGMMVTDDESLDQRFRLLRQHGMSITDLQRHQLNKIVIETYDILGFNYRMTDIQAAIGIEQLKKLPDIVGARREIARWYLQFLTTIPWVSLPHEPAYARANWQSFAVRVLPSAPRSRDEIMQALLEKGIHTKPGIMNAHQEAVYREMQVRLPESERARRDVILLPLYTQLKEADVRMIADTLGSL